MPADNNSFSVSCTGAHRPCCTKPQRGYLLSATLTVVVLHY